MAKYPAKKLDFFDFLPAPLKTKKVIGKIDCYNCNGIIYQVLENGVIINYDVYGVGAHDCETTKHRREAFSE